MFLLRFRRRHRFGPEAERAIHPAQGIPGYDPEEVIPFDPEGELDGCLNVLDFEPEPSPEKDGEGWREAGPDEQ